MLKRSLSPLFTLAMTVTACTSGSTSTSDSKLIGGRPSDDKQFPTVVLGTSLGNGMVSPDCSGVFISRTHLLTAAHCFFDFNRMDLFHWKYDHSPYQLAYSHGKRGENPHMGNIKKVFIPAELKPYLHQAKGWEDESNIANAHDLVMIELKEPISEAIGLAEISDRALTVGEKIRFGGFGCEKSPLIPTDDSVPVLGEQFKPVLKYAQGDVTKVLPLVATGPTYTGNAKVSGCPGDSGGPVFLDTDVSRPEAPLYKIVGINSSVDNSSAVKTQMDFTIITPDSKLGQWVVDALAGRIEPFSENSDD